MYFLLAGMAKRFELLKHGIALILIFIGCTMVIEPWFKIPTLFSLGVVSTILITFIWVSMKFRVRKG
jgi:tellurite resistance protein TerC